MPTGLFVLVNAVINPFRRVDHIVVMTNGWLPLLHLRRGDPASELRALSGARGGPLHGAEPRPLMTVKTAPARPMVYTTGAAA